MARRSSPGFAVFWAIAVIVGCQRADNTSTVKDTSYFQPLSGAPTTPNPPTPHEPGSAHDTGIVGSPVNSSPYIRPFPVVMYDSASEEVLKPYAEGIAKLLGIGIVQPSPRNPVCCVWLELTDWTPNPGRPGYIINNQPGGSVIQASDEEQLRLAVEHFESTARHGDDGVEVLTGLLTNYDVQLSNGNSQ